MKMREKVYVDRLFADYEDTPAIRDFKEEIVGNLKERVKELTAQGLDDERAFEKATAELGDITAIADEIGKKKRKEAIGQLYMDKKAPLTKKAAAGFAVGTALFLFGACISLIVIFSDFFEVEPYYYIAVVLVSAAVGIFAYFGLTYESATEYAMVKGRALAYSVLTVVGVMGSGLVSTIIFDWIEITPVVIIGIALIVPAISAAVFLGSTEADRRKPWARDIEDLFEVEFETAFSCEGDIVNPAKAARFGIASGGLWVLTLALFLTLFFVVGWQYAWLVFIFAVPIQVFMVATIFDIEKCIEMGKGK